VASPRSQALRYVSTTGVSRAVYDDFHFARLQGARRGCEGPSKAHPSAALDKGVGAVNACSQTFAFDTPGSIVPGTVSRASLPKSGNGRDIGAALLSVYQTA
jgi:hypothetical protein